MASPHSEVPRAHQESLHQHKLSGLTMNSKVTPVTGEIPAILGAPPRNLDKGQLDSLLGRGMRIYLHEPSHTCTCMSSVIQRIKPYLLNMPHKVLHYLAPLLLPSSPSSCTELLTLPGTPALPLIPRCTSHPRCLT